jgi:hypothetical protein
MAFEDIRVHVRLKLFALWSSVMFFYIYGDYFQLWQPGQLQQMIAGRMPFGANPQKVLLGMAGMMVVPSLMPFLSLVLPVRLNRWLNIIDSRLFFLHSRWVNEAAFDKHVERHETNQFVERVQPLIDHPFDVTRTHLLFE